MVGIFSDGQQYVARAWTFRAGYERAADAAERSYELSEQGL
ncbi:MAG: hypothetical protein QOF31_3143, partial [Mycobacterium sp.]|nr:hypothetical protein [Mycobacterium sp.]